MKLWQAVGFLWAAGRMFPRWRQAHAHRSFIKRSDMAARLTHRALDFILATIALLLLAPIMLFIASILAPKGPIFAKRLQFGVGGKPYVELRFRTYEIAGQINRRHTRIGQFLRQTSLDELPQLINILRSEMSFVGPRPESSMTTKLSSKPGLSGAAFCEQQDQSKRASSVIGGIALTMADYCKAIVAGMRRNLTGPPPE